MLFGGTLRFEGERGISNVVREEDAFIQVQVEGGNAGELVLEFSPQLAEALRTALNELKAGSQIVRVGELCDKCIIKPSLYLHYEDEEVVAGFRDNDDNPLRDQWPTLHIKKPDLFDLELHMNPEQAESLGDLCQRLVGLGTAVKSLKERALDVDA